MAEHRHFPYFGAAMRIIRAVHSVTQDDIGALMGVEGEQVGRYERNESRPTLETLGGLLEALGLTLTDFDHLMQVAEQMLTRRSGNDFQYELWTEVPSEIGEQQVEWVTSILYCTDRGKLVAVNDPTINRLLDSTLATRKPRQEVLVTLEIPNHPRPRERKPKRGRKAGKRSKR